MQFEHLFRPAQIGPMQIPNRICWSAHASQMAAQSLPTARQLDYLVERAKGGAGWLVVGGSVIDEETTALSHGQNTLTEDAVPMYRELVERVHAHGSVISTQIDHYGSIVGYPRSGRGVALSPAGVPDGHEVPKVMREEDMAFVIARWERAAGVVRASGFDGAEILVSMGYSLLQQFLSPRQNQRTDEYGGSLENRMRFPLRVLAAVRAALGPDIALGVKLVGDELAEDGLGEEELLEIAAGFAASGFIDYLHVDIGSSSDHTVWLPEMSYPPGFATYLAAGVRERVDIPVLAVKRIADPVQAEKILADGQADVVAMARALIADPELPNKAREGRLDDIRQCTASNQECNGRETQRLPISCIHNPAVGFEARWGIGTVTAAPQRKRVVVVGGGPAGMKTAELAAERGHEVLLFEASGALGGQVNWLGRVNSRKDYEVVTRYLIHRTKRLGVDVQLGSRLGADEVVGLEADAVVIATGAIAPSGGAVPGLPAAVTGSPNVRSILDVFAGDLDAVGARVVVVDRFGDAEGGMVAEYLADHGREVEVVTALPYPGCHTDPYSLELLLGRLAEREIPTTAWTRLERVEGTTVTGVHTVTGEEWVREADAVVIAGAKLANEALYLDLQGRVAELYRVGDCVAPRRITDAILEGNVVGRQL